MLRGGAARFNARLRDELLNGEIFYTLRPWLRWPVSERFQAIAKLTEPELVAFFFDEAYEEFGLSSTQALSF